MTIWVIFAFLTATVMAGLLLPVLRRREGPAAARADYDLAVFRDQLAELERDAARGAIAPAEAQAAGNEIARRLIAASAPAAATPSRRAAPIVALAGALLIPVIALPLYLSRGRPALPDVPYAERLANAVANRDFDALVAKVEAHLVKQPDDIAGWKVLAPAYRQAQRWDDAARAFKRIIELSRPDAGTFSDYGEMLVFANQGMVAAEAAKAFADALKIEPKLPTARFFAAVALKQEGKTEEARAALAAFLAETPAGAPWRAMLEAELKDLDSRPPPLSQDQLSAGANMSAADRDKTVRSMVDGLEAKLRANGDDLEGWQRLIRARMVLNEMDKTMEALATARAQFKDRPAALATLDGLAKDIGMP